MIHIFEKDLTNSIDDIVKPFLLACDSKNNKMISISITTINKIVLHKCLPIVYYIFLFIFFIIY